ncbi:related to Asparagine synthetase domain-containing protein YML096W [Saccharomycodes ludwigii]|uniref:Related to Asparagine synthetase domain-containing protein YML096W n=1 Tax=Saccharomycodes ludwigii TaxID=36035 RepID=A0A376B6J3_9ASCO|nr:related to Asparagine synthetase domain-containing protein YML096W [Saccharomycodes ludwigii]
MCGILFYNGENVKPKDYSNDAELLLEFYEKDITRARNNTELTTSTQFNNLIPYIISRGPNYCSLRYDPSSQNFWFSSVLSLRSPFTKQCVSNERYVLQYNGELYNDCTTASLLEFENDTMYILKELSSSEHGVTDVIRKLNGEFAYTIYDKLENCIYFGRDKIGRRSLSYQLNSDDNANTSIYITSCSGKSQGSFINCDGGVIYKYAINQHTLTEVGNIKPDYMVTNMVDLEFQHMDTKIDQLYELLQSSIYKRLVTIHPLHAEQNPISVLFSGGLDCSIIVSLICQELVRQNREKDITIELLNVGFESPRTNMKPSETPDRLLAIESAKIIKGNFPNIDIRLLEVDVSYQDYVKFKEHVVDLIYPKATVMDLSIAIAFYFAASGKSNSGYNRNGIVLFSGLGADELFGGYYKFLHKSLSEIQVQLIKEINNIHDRNLSRDDKVISSHGVEVRYPFLDDDLIEFTTTSIPLNYKVNKLILRKLASKHLNLGKICEEPKRAIQFGSKTAKIVDGKGKGTDIL